jgi:hypothetical protein
MFQELVLLPSSGENAYSVGTTEDANRNPWSDFKNRKKLRVDV